MPYRPQKLKKSEPKPGEPKKHQFRADQHSDLRHREMTTRSTLSRLRNRKSDLKWVRLWSKRTPKPLDCLLRNPNQKRQVSTVQKLETLCAMLTFRLGLHTKYIQSGSLETVGKANKCRE
jgi:hypothetical protein